MPAAEAFQDALTRAARALGAPLAAIVLLIALILVTIYRFAPGPVSDPGHQVTPTTVDVSPALGTIGAVAADQDSVRAAFGVRAEESTSTIAPTTGPAPTDPPSTRPRSTTTPQTTTTTIAPSTTTTTAAPSTTTPDEPGSTSSSATSPTTTASTQPQSTDTGPPTTGVATTDSSTSSVTVATTAAS